MVTTISIAIRIAALLTVVATMTLVLASSAQAAHLAPIFFEGPTNRTCGELSQDPDIVELKVDPPANGVYSDGNLTVAISGLTSAKVFDWSANLGIDSVFVKAGSAGSFLYAYPPEARSDEDLTSPGSGTTNQISHISFCYDLEALLTVVKVVDPVDDAGRFDLRIDLATFADDVGHDGTTGEVEVEPGLHLVDEVAGAGTSLGDYQAVIGGDCSEAGVVSVALGETKRCIITNYREGRLEVLKTVSGGTQDAAGYAFDVRSAASTTSLGTTLSSATTDATGGAFLGGLAAYSDPSSGTLASYAFCETGLLPGWHSSLADAAGSFVPGGALPEPDNSVICVAFSVAPGETIVFAVDNDPPPGGDARTIGFWRNWSSCTGGHQDPVLDETLASLPGNGTLLGDRFVDECTEAVRLLSKRDADTGANRASDGAYALASQLLAAQLNLQRGAGSCAAADAAIAAGQALLDEIGFVGTGSYLPSKGWGDPVRRAQSHALAGEIDAYNNNVLC